MNQQETSRRYIIISRRFLAGLALLSLGLLGGKGTANGGELVYQPNNPSFGGDPFVGSFLLGKAQSQDTHQDPDRPSFELESPTQRLIQSLESRLISRLIADVSSGDISEGAFDSEDFGVVVRDEGGQLVINVTDKLTGDVTTVSVGGFAVNEF